MGRLTDAITTLYERLRRSKTSRQILLYLFFVLMSAVFWCFITFNDRVTIKMEIPVVIVQKPDNVRFLTHVADTVTVELQGKSSSFLRYLFRSNPKLELPFAMYADGNGQWRVSSSQLRRCVGTILYKATVIESIQPDILSASYTDQEGKPVPVVVLCDVSPALGHARTGPVEQSADTVLIYGNPAKLREISQVYTYQLTKNDITDTLRTRLKIAPISGTLIEPASIDITVPVEPLINATRANVRVQVRNVPDSCRVLTFPYQVDAKFRTPKSYAQRIDATLTAVLDYSQLDPNATSRVATVAVGEASGMFQDIKFYPDTVEFLIEYLDKKR